MWSKRSPRAGIFSSVQPGNGNGKMIRARLSLKLMSGPPFLRGSNRRVLARYGRRRSFWPEQCALGRCQCLATTTFQLFALHLLDRRAPGFLRPVDLARVIRRRCGLSNGWHRRRCLGPSRAPCAKRRTRVSLVVGLGLRRQPQNPHQRRQVLCSGYRP
jgi:hypothetical protein